MLAFTSDRDGSMDIFMMNADGSDQRRQTFEGRNDGWASWSPDGTHLAYHSVQGSRGILNILDVSAGSIEPLEIPLEGSLWEPAWSHDGNRIAFSHQPVQGESDIYIFDLAASGLTRLTDAPGYDGGPYWSPDDSQIAFYSDRDGNFEVYVMNEDGTSQRRLTEDPASDLVTSWSPDGTRLAFFSDRDGNDELYTIGIDGSALTRLTENPATDREPAFSPDGTRIAFISDRDGNLEVYVAEAPAPGLPIDESTIRRLTDTSRREMLPVWMPEKTLSITYGEWRSIIPIGAPLSLDGQLAPGEWDRALRQETTNGGGVLFMQAGDFLYVGVDANFGDVLVATLCLAAGEEVSILHSSASLGAAVFKSTGERWQLIQAFDWALYGVTSQSAAAQNDRRAYLEANGWLASLGTMTTTGETEFQVAIPAGPFHLAVAYLLPPEGNQAAWWPADLADDCRRIELLQGNSGETINPPLGMQFAPGTWAAITSP